MKKNIGSGVHAVLTLAALVLIFVSSAMAYSLSDLNIVLLMGGIVVIADIVMMLFGKKGSVLFDVLALCTTALATLCLCRIINGRADLMGYVWFSDLEKGNPTAVTSLYLATASMVCLVIGVVMNIVSGFMKQK